MDVKLPAAEGSCLGWNDKKGGAGNHGHDRPLSSCCFQDQLSSVLCKPKNAHFCLPQLQFSPLQGSPCSVKPQSNLPTPDPHFWLLAEFLCAKVKTSNFTSPISFSSSYLISILGNYFQIERLEPLASSLTSYSALKSGRWSYTPSTQTVLFGFFCLLFTRICVSCSRWSSSPYRPKWPLQGVLLLGPSTAYAFQPHARLP